ncbi:hypothetical protein ASPWEDRAFT_175059 [Aspergillus wentii DTO 134E9]|uniref:Uncharacterized protein n=1 Tax=Aspergillus wentii DTO 134E9 TaxID=1073089 RepID=A0A1L9R9Y3_ASPWE|nr:uncharacterized protein ASPWEDRAFT_670697 [Aspergillus wentii DTO 134E9]XP_040685412.1 uncharacterized protein ASPWEDRAFT_175059 [Aspergillus wentii DTO 134E9]KAI9927383.1 hypothetical protein MW887_002995 [Aspergillus wentii]OJJ30746.1 hypothetical protein ASPWEDRAFT_670697 [Aspergillus wentii DTO 134E9]OJJ31735.1 hypothetical protein ASPWEDRAFT_175059 [Aspergillus wentii DTO 134E9]
MSDPSIIFFKGLKCTKVPRISPVAATTRSSSGSSALPVEPIPITASSASNITLQTPVSTSDPTSFIETSLSTSSSTLERPLNTSTTSSLTQQNTISTTSAPPLTTSSTTFTTTPTATSIHEPYSPSESRNSSSSSILVSSGSIEHPSPLLISITTESKSVSSSLGTHRVFSTNSPTATGHVAGANPSKTPSDGLGYSNSNNTLRTVLGSVLGALAFFALILLACFLVYRHRRRKSRSTANLGGSETLLLNGRGSAASSAMTHGRCQSDTSSHSTRSSMHSHMRNFSGAPAPPRSARVENPFSDMQEIQHEKFGPHGMFGTVQDPFADPEPNRGPPSMRQASLSEPRLQPIQKMVTTISGLQFSSDQASLCSSDQSYGSTIILPGRSSLGSLQGARYQLSISEPRSARQRDSFARVSTRSDPFDLELPQSAMQRDTYFPIREDRV